MDNLLKGLILLAQSDFHALNIEFNAQKACKIIEENKNNDLDLIIFPEMFLVGYPFGNVLERFHSVVKENLKWLEFLAQKTAKTKVIIGFVEKENNKFYNSLAVLMNGKIETVIRKSDLQNNEIFEDYKIIETKNFKAGIINCECGYNYRNFDKDFKNLETFIKQNNPDILINCSASISRTNKEQQKNKMLKKIAQKMNKPLVYVNTVGANEALSFDGISRVYSSNGEVIARAKAFEEQLLKVDFGKENEINNLPKGLEKEEIPTSFSLNYENDIERLYLSSVQAIKDYFRKTGFKKAVLGLSGGLDSTVSAVLLADALGSENVFGVSMPSSITTNESKNDAQQLAQNLGIGFCEMPIADMFSATSNTLGKVFENVETKWDNRYKKSFTNDNIQARSRATILWGIANEFGRCLPIATSDKSEAYMGYATINGDMSGGFAPLADITKTKLFALASWMNKNRINKNAIPQSIIDKRPGAELAMNPKTNKPLLAEEALMPYEFLDEVIWRIENSHQTIADMQQEKFLYELENNISQEQKTEWLQKFFKRMSTAHFKWTIMPTVPIMDSHSINSAEYYQPIISSKIKY